MMDIFILMNVGHKCGVWVRRIQRMFHVPCRIFRPLAPSMIEKIFRGFLHSRAQWPQPKGPWSLKWCTAFARKKKHAYKKTCVHRCTHAMHTRMPSIHAYMHTCMDGCMHTCMMYAYIHAYVHAQTYIYACKHACMYVYVCVDACKHTHAYTHKRAHARTRARIYAHIAGMHA